jgi:8-amino-7-oxononanoate synthase
MTTLDEALAAELEALERAGLRRQLRRWDGPQGAWFKLEGRRVLNFASNNYLDLASHEIPRSAARSAVDESGLGAGSARLVAGNHSEHEQLETELARFHRLPAALLFNSGFQANVGIIPALVGSEDVVLSDALNHASIVDGCRLSRAQVKIYRHADAADARRKLGAARRSARRALVITESLFSMDGDPAPLAELREACAEFDAWLMVDEAHAVGVLGPGGRGLSAEVGAIPEVLVGTLGKAFGSFGAYAVGSAALRELLVHGARSFVFTTALPPQIAAASRAALSLAASPEGDAARARLRQTAQLLADRLEALELGSPNTSPDGHIQPVILGDERQTMEVSQGLLARGVYAPGIRPPTVPRGTSRLRLSLTAGHKAEDIEQLIAGLAGVLRPSGGARSA